jgi:hypothetical protein
LRPAKEVVKKTNKRRNTAAEKPGSRILVEKLGFPKAKFTKLPIIKKQSQVKMENKERPEHRLKFRILSFLIKRI